MFTGGGICVGLSRRQVICTVPNKKWACSCGRFAVSLNILCARSRFGPATPHACRRRRGETAVYRHPVYSTWWHTCLRDVTADDVMQVREATTSFTRCPPPPHRTVETTMHVLGRVRSGRVTELGRVSCHCHPPIGGRRCAKRVFSIYVRLAHGFTRFRLRLRQIRNPAIFGNPVKSGSGQMSSRVYRIWRMPVQLQYLQLITDRTKAADLSQF